MYAAFVPDAGPGAAPQPPAPTTTSKAGSKLFLANCATCHGVQAPPARTAGPSLVGVGAASVDFQVGTGRMPLAAPDVQAQRNKVQFTEEQIDADRRLRRLARPRPGHPGRRSTPTIVEGANLARGGELFRVNCAMCHNFAGSGGALTRGKYAPPLRDIEGKHIYEAMLTGPQRMPVFNDANLTPDEQARHHRLPARASTRPNNTGGHALGSFGPVGDGFFLWLIAMPIMLGAAVWLGRKAA